jgi:hypothetical protein
MSTIEETTAPTAPSNAGSPAAVSLRFAKPAISFAIKSSDQVLTVISGRILASMTANAAYPAPVPTVAELGTVRDAFIVAVNGNDRGALAIAARNKARAALVAVLRELALYVAARCKGDRVTLLSSGYPAQRDRTPAAHTAPPMPGNVRADPGPMSGQIIARCERIPGGVLYQWRFATVQAPTAYTVTDTGSRASVTLENMVPGTQYLIQVRACGRRGSSDWSNAVTKYAV